MVDQHGQKMIDKRIIRTEREKDLSYVDKWFLKPGEWSHDPDGNTKESEPEWIQRYEYERDILLPIIDQYDVKQIIELGSGPGTLSQMILDLRVILDYHLIDKDGAQMGFEHRKYKGTFYVKDLNLEFDVSGLPIDFDMIIANDFFEHIQAPSEVILQSREILKKDGLYFVSVPNWRNGHDFIYRGLFDFDNFVFMMNTHGFDLIAVADSPLKTPITKRLDSERMLPDDLLNSWNWYFLFKKEE